MTLDDDIYSQVGAGLGAVGAAVLGPVVQVLKEIFKVNSCFREHSVKTPAAEAGKRDKPASQAVPLEQGQVHSLLSLASQEKEVKEEIKAKSWTGTKGSSCPQGEVALAVAGRRGKPPLRPTSTTGKQLLLKRVASLSQSWILLAERNMMLASHWSIFLSVFWLS